MRLKITTLLSLLLLFGVGLFAQSPNIQISISPTTPCAGQPFSFSAIDANGVYSPWSSWSWSFGNGGWANGPSGSTTIATAGTYNCQLYVWDSLAGGGGDTVFFNIYVTNTCVGTDLIEGFIWYDINSNGVQDPGEQPLPQQMVQIQPSGVIFTTDQQGNYSGYVAANTHTVGVIPPPNWGISSPAAGSYSVTTTGSGTIYGGNDFGIEPDQIVDDAAVYGYSAPFVPGFGRRIYVFYKNKGTSVLSGSVTLNYDPSILHFGSASNSGTNSSGTVTWNYSNMNPWTNGYFYADFVVDTQAVLGDTLCYNTSITPYATDVDQSNNQDTNCSVIVGSYDPNDKTVYPAGQGATNIVAPGTQLRYRIRFQNTGTYHATNVVVRDTIEADLDLATFQMLGASHPHTWSISHDRVITWTFNNIMLPDSNSNEPESHGYIMFSMDHEAGVSLGTPIENRAGIYFDFNPVVLTNYTLTTIDIPASIEPGVGAGSNLLVYPHPVTDLATIEFTPKTGLNYELQVVSLEGKVMRSIEAPATGRISFDRGQLKSGLYLYRLLGSDGSSVSGKLMVH